MPSLAETRVPLAAMWVPGLFTSSNLSPVWPHPYLLCSKKHNEKSWLSPASRWTAFCFYMEQIGETTLKRNFYIALLLALLPNLGLAWLYFSVATTRLEESLQSDLQLESELKANDVESSLANLRGTLRSLATLKAFSVALQFERYEGLQNLFDAIVQGDRNYTGMIFANAKGDLLAFSTIDHAGAYLPNAESNWNEVVARYHEPLTQDGTAFVELADGTKTRHRHARRRRDALGCL